MRRFYTKMVLFVLLVVFCIFFGVDIANRGMERIQGPAVAPATGGRAVNAAGAPVAAQPAVKAAPAPAAMAPAPAAAIPPKPEPVRTGQDEAMNYVGNKVGDLLQIAAHHTIRTVVSLFGALIG